MWNDDDFESDDPLVRHNAHQAAKGRGPLPDPDALRDRPRMHQALGRCWCGLGHSIQAAIELNEAA